MLLHGDIPPLGVIICHLPLLNLLQRNVTSPSTFATGLEVGLLGMSMYFLFGNSVTFNLCHLEGKKKKVNNMVFTYQSGVGISSLCLSLYS